MEVFQINDRSISETRKPFDTQDLTDFIVGQSGQQRLAHG